MLPWAWQSIHNNNRGYLHIGTKTWGAFSSHRPPGLLALGVHIYMR